MQSSEDLVSDDGDIEPSVENTQPMKNKKRMITRKKSTGTESQVQENNTDITSGLKAVDINEELLSESSNKEEDSTHKNNQTEIIGTHKSTVAQSQRVLLNKRNKDTDTSEEPIACAQASTSRANSREPASNTDTDSITTLLNSPITKDRHRKMRKRRSIFPDTDSDSSAKLFGEF